MRKAFLTACCLMALLTHAQPAEAQWLVTPLVGGAVRGRTGHFDPDEVAASRKVVFGVAVSKTWRRFGVEAEAASVPGFFSGRDAAAIITGSSLRTVSGNLITSLPRIGRFRPYAVAGLGAAHVGMRDVADVFPVSEWQLIFNVGAGVMVPAGRRLSFGADTRYFRSRRGEGVESSIGFGTTFVDFWRVSARMAIALGGSS